MSIYQACKGGTLHIIKAPPRYRKEVEERARQALAAASKLFGYKRLAQVVIFSASPEFAIPEVGLGAHAILQGDIVVNIDFSRKDVKRVLKKELAPALYHELSHIVRQSVNKNLYATLQESLVTEGISSYVEKEVFQKKVPYIAPIQNETRYWRKAKKILGKKDYSHAEWFFGHGKILPRWIGYRLGYLLVAGFMKKQKKMPLAQLVRISSQEVLGDQQKP